VPKGFVPVSDLAQSGAFSGSTRDAQERAARRWAEGLPGHHVRKRSGRWEAHESALLPGSPPRTVRAFRKGFNPPPFKTPADYFEWTDAERAKQANAAELVARFDEHLSANSNKSLHLCTKTFRLKWGKWAEERGLSVHKRALDRYRKRLKAGKKIDTRGRPKTKTSSNCSPEAWEYFNQHYLRIQRPSVTICYQLTAAEAGKKGWSWPSLRTIQLRVQKELPPHIADLGRRGEREWKAAHEPKMRRDYSLLRAGQQWVSDFKTLDVFCRRDEHDTKPVRPLLCAWQDMRTRMIMGYYVTLRECSDSVLITFRRGVEAYGPPWGVILDNGKPFRARGVSGGRRTNRFNEKDQDYLRSVFGGLKIEVKFTEPYTPQSKPIERWFRTMDEQCCVGFDTYCGGDNKSDRFKHAAKLAKKHPEKCPTIKEFSDLLGSYIEEVYHHAQHKGLEGMTPVEAFGRCNPIPKLIPPEGAMELLTMRTTRPVKVTRDGVRHNGILYTLTAQEHFNLRGREVILRIDPQDASYVVCCDTAGKPICKAVNNRARVSGLSQDDIAAAHREKARYKKLVKAITKGGLRVGTEDKVHTAVRVRGQQLAEQQRLKATGTEDEQPIRNVRPLHSDWTEAVNRYQSKVTPPPKPENQIKIEDLGDLFSEEVEEKKPEKKYLDPADFYDLYYAKED